MAGLGCLIAGHLALDQLKVIGSVWEPWFGAGSKIVLHSPLSRILPIPDAALGAVAYLRPASCSTRARSA